MQCYLELTAPTAVTHSISLPFVSAQSNNLVVGKSSLLQIFRAKTVTAEVEPSESAQSRRNADNRLINEDDGLNFLGGDTTIRPDRATVTKLVLVAEVALAGVITGFARIKTQKKELSGDALLIAFKDAKLSLVEWDADTSSLSTISIHYYEQDDLSGAPWAAPLSEYPNFLAADPGSRCAALKFGARNLAILPFTQADEDMDMADWDEDLDGPRLEPAVKDTADGTNGTSNSMQLDETPYSPSFVLRLPNLDPSLLHPVHLAFLHEYREPTFGILSSTQYCSHSLGRKDHLTYMVFTLDLQQKASTTILSVTGLPQDLFRVVALPKPLGGALLLGANELIHVDQSGKPHGVAVNPLAKQSTSFGLVDHSHLNLRLEGCEVEVLAAETGELLIVLNDGRLALVSFKVDGRTVSGLDVKVVSPEAGGSIIPCGVASLTRLGRNSMFAGSEDGDSLVLGWTKKQGQGSKRKSRVLDAGLDLDLDDEDLDDEDEDDLYATETSPAPITAIGSASKLGDTVFRIHDRMLSIAPIRTITYGKSSFSPQSEEENNATGVQSDLRLVAAVGRDGAGALAILNREIQPKVIGRFEFPEARGLWTMYAKKPLPKPLAADKDSGAVGQDYDLPDQYDKYMIVAKMDLDGYETSDVYALTAAGFEGLTGTEFEPAAGFTVEAGTMGKNNRIIQVLKSEVRCYTGDLGLSQILPMLDEETGTEPRVVSASIADPFLLLIRDDSSAFIAQIDSSHELEELDKGDKVLVSTKWLTGCLYTDVDGVFAEVLEKGSDPGENILMFLLSASGALHVYRLPDLTRPVYVTEGVSYIPPSISADYTTRRGTAKETIAEILVADLGDVTYRSPYLILRHANDDLTIYQPQRTLKPGSEGLSDTLWFQKVPNTAFAKSPEEADQDDATHAPRFLPMRACRNIAGYSTVFLPGASASFLIKSAKSTPKLMGLQGTGVQAMSSFHTEGCEHGFIYADSHGIARVTQIPSNCSYGELGLSVRKVPLHGDVSAVAYHPPSETWVIGCHVKEEFELPKDDDHHKEWAREDISFKPTSERGVLKVVSPITWATVDAFDMEPYEQILCVETLNLEVSESTNERKQLLAVGTAITRGEDLPTRGRVYVFDVADVIPEPDRPETNRKLKLVAKEDIPRGAVTAISGVGTQGLMLVAQGQKCMVRGLKEDGTLLPVAFMDMNCYVTCVKELPGTSLCLMADAFKGLWFTGYTEEPYKMMLFGKSSTTLEVLNADFLPDEQELYLVANDADGYIHILQFDPEHPKSLQGHLLLHRTTFNAGAHGPTCSLLLPRTLPALPTPQTNGTKANGITNGDHHEVSVSQIPQILLLGSPTGVLAVLSPLSEAAYRRLSSLVTQLTNNLPHAAGLNPRMYRLPSQGSFHPPGVDEGMGAGRVMVDGAMLARWSELSTGRRSDLAGRVGFSAQEEVRAELEGLLGWGGMAYF